MTVVNLGQGLNVVVEEVVSSEEKNLHLTHTMNSPANIVIAKGPPTPASSILAPPLLKELSHEETAGKVAFSL